MAWLVKKKCLNITWMYAAFLTLRRASDESAFGSVESLHFFPSTSTERQKDQNTLSKVHRQKSAVFFTSSIFVFCFTFLSHCQTSPSWYWPSSHRPAWGLSQCQWKNYHLEGQGSYLIEVDWKLQSSRVTRPNHINLSLGCAWCRSTFQECKYIGGQTACCYWALSNCRNNQLFDMLECRSLYSCPTQISSRWLTRLPQV